MCEATIRNRRGERGLAPVGRGRHRSLMQFYLRSHDNPPSTHFLPLAHQIGSVPVIPLGCFPVFSVQESAKGSVLLKVNEERPDLLRVDGDLGASWRWRGPTGVAWEQRGSVQHGPWATCFLRSSPSASPWQHGSCCVCGSHCGCSPQLTPLDRTALPEGLSFLASPEDTAHSRHVLGALGLLGLVSP